MGSKAKDVSALEAVEVPPELVLDAEAMFAGLREIGIRHRGSLYRLSMTRQGKLILTK